MTNVGRVDSLGGLIPDTVDGVPYEPPRARSLDSYNRDELDEYARSVGIENPETYGTKADLIAAITEGE